MNNFKKKNTILACVLIAITFVVFGWQIKSVYTEKAVAKEHEKELAIQEQKTQETIKSLKSQNFGKQMPPVTFD